VQNEDPSYSGGANQVSLTEARWNFVAFGAAEASSLGRVRGPSLEEIPTPPVLLGLHSDLRDMKERALKIALLGMVRSIKAGTVPLLQGCTAVSALAWPMRTQGVIEECLRLFEGVASEVEDMPTGDTRNLWAPSALFEKDGEMAAFEKKVQDAVMAACRQMETALAAELKN